MWAGRPEETRGSRVAGSEAWWRGLRGPSAPETSRVSAGASRRRGGRESRLGDVVSRRARPEGSGDARCRCDVERPLAAAPRAEWAFGHRGTGGTGRPAPRPPLCVGARSRHKSGRQVAARRRTGRTRSGIDRPIHRSASARSGGAVGLGRRERFGFAEAGPSRRGTSRAVGSVIRMGRERRPLGPLNPAVLGRDGTAPLSSSARPAARGTAHPARGSVPSTGPSPWPSARTARGTGSDRW